MHLVVEPNGRSRGTGRRLYDHCLLQLEKDCVEGAHLYTTTRETHAHVIGFLEAEGFQCFMPEELSQLNLKSFDPTLFISKLIQTEANRIAVKSLRKLQVQFLDWKRRIYLLESELGVDIPGAGPYIPWQFAEHCQRKFSGPHFHPDAIWIALQDGECLSMTEFSLPLGEPKKAHTGQTGMRRKSRRKCIATDLKLEALDFAQRNHIRIVQTNNEENNRLFQINRPLGLNPFPPLFTIGKTFNQRTESPWATPCIPILPEEPRTQGRLWH